jgi:hypothetical protein
VAKFEIGDVVRLTGVPFVVEVKELGVCEDGPDCDKGIETFRFRNPGSPDDWRHSSEFERV